MFPLVYTCCTLLLLRLEILKPMHLGPKWTSKEAERLHKGKADAFFSEIAEICVSDRLKIRYWTFVNWVK